MKTRIILLILAAGLLAPAWVRAELLIYKGTAKESYLGDGQQLKVSSKVIVIIDRETANIARLQYATVNGYKTYYTSHTTNLHFVQVTGANGKISTLIAHVPSECELKDDPDSEGLYLSGANGSLSPDGKATIAFPKVLSGGGRGLFYSKSNHSPNYGEISVTVAYNQNESVTSNNSAETQEAALARYEAQIRAQGYNP